MDLCSWSPRPYWWPDVAADPDPRCTLAAEGKVQPVDPRQIKTGTDRTGCSKWTHINPRASFFCFMDRYFMRKELVNVSNPLDPSATECTHTGSYIEFTDAGPVTQYAVTQFYGRSRQCGPLAGAQFSMGLGRNPLINGLIQHTFQINFLFVEKFPVIP